MLQLSIKTQRKNPNSEKLGGKEILLLLIIPSVFKGGGVDYYSAAIVTPALVLFSLASLTATASVVLSSIFLPAVNAVCKT